MSVQNPHQFSPLWLFSNSKQLNTQKSNKTGFASLNGGHIPIKRTYSSEVPENLIINNSTFKTKTSEFPTLQSTRSTKVAVDTGAWSQPRGKGKPYNTVKQASKPNNNNAAPNNTAKPRPNEASAEKPNSPKGKSTKQHETSKFDFFKSLRLDEGLLESDSESVTCENDNSVECNVQDSVMSVPLSSSVEIEHRLLKDMGWSDETEPPLTEEEVLTARRDIEANRRPRTPPTLSPFPWAPKIYIPDDNEGYCSSDTDEDY